MSILQSEKRKMQKFAFDKIEEVTTNFEKYKSVAESLGMMLYTNGLVSVLAFYRGKNSGEYKMLYEDLEAWLTKKSIIKDLIPGTHEDDFLERILKIENSRDLMIITKEAVKLSDALKEMVKAKA